MTDFNLGRYQTNTLVKLDTYGPGTTVKTMEIRGNAMLSSVFIKSADPGATVKVNYFQTSAGTVPLGERFDLSSHTLLDASNAGTTQQIVVTRIHNKPLLEYIVTGGNVEFGVYVTVNDELASDIDSALVLDTQTGNLNIDKGIPTACYDEANNQWRLLRCNSDGTLPVSLDLGDPLFREGTATVNQAGNPNALDSFVIPVDKLYRVSNVYVTGLVNGSWTLTAGGVTIGKGRLGPSELNSRFPFNPNREVSAGTTVALTFDSLLQTPSDCTVDWFLQMRESDV